MRACGAEPLPFNPDDPPIEAAPDPNVSAEPGPATIAARAVSTALKGPGILPRVAPRLAIDTEELQHWTRTNVRAQRQTGWSSR